jgi:hypothetical protein
MAGSVAGLTAGVIVTQLFKLGAEETAGSPVAVSADGPGPAGSLKASSRSSWRSGKGKPPPLVADWAPAVMVQPAVDPASGESRDGGMSMMVGVRGLLH